MAGAGRPFANAAGGLIGFANGTVEVEVAILDGTDGKGLFHHIEKASGMLSSPDPLFDGLGSALAKKFPYRKESP